MATNAPILTDAEDLDRMILEDLSHPHGRTLRTPAFIAARLGLDRDDVATATRRLETEGLLDRWMGLRPSQAGYDHLNTLRRRT